MFVKYITISRLPWVVSASDVPLPSRPGVGTTAVPMDAPSERRLVTGALRSYCQPPRNCGGAHDPAVKEDEENRQSHCPVACGS